MFWRYRKCYLIAAIMMGLSFTSISQEAQKKVSLLLKTRNTFDTSSSPSKFNKLILQRLPLFTLPYPDKLPMFCALEKKLYNASNIWIKIRLPEKPLTSQFYRK